MANFGGNKECWRSSKAKVEACYKIYSSKNIVKILWCILKNDKDGHKYLFSQWLNEINMVFTITC